MGGIALPKIFFRTNHRWISLAIRLVWLYNFVIHPCVFHDWKMHALSMLVMLVVSGSIVRYWRRRRGPSVRTEHEPHAVAQLISIFVINHNTIRTREASEKLGPTKDWAAMQVVESVNYAPNSEFWTWWSGGLNYQVWSTRPAARHAQPARRAAD